MPTRLVSRTVAPPWTFPGCSSVDPGASGDDIIDQVQRPLPWFLEDDVDDLQTVVRTTVDTASTAVTHSLDMTANSVTETAEWAGDRIEDGAEWAGDRGEDVAEWGGDRLDDAGDAIDWAEDKITFWN